MSFDPTKDICPIHTGYMPERGRPPEGSEFCVNCSHIWHEWINLRRESQTFQRKGFREGSYR